MEIKYRKKPIIIEAIQWTGDNWEEIGQFCGQVASLAKEYGKNILLIDTLESNKNKFQATEGDWIIKGIKGEFYACKPDIFEATYEPVSKIQDAEMPKKLIKGTLPRPDYYYDGYNQCHDDFLAYHLKIISKK